MKKIILFSLLFALAFQFAPAQNQTVISGKPALVKVKVKRKVLVPPQIQWVNPSADQIETNSSDFLLKACINSETEIEYIRLYVNGLMYSKDRGFKPVQELDCATMYEKRLSLSKGNNEIKLVVKNAAENETTQKRFVLYHSGQDIGGRKDYALLFATDHYDHWDNLVNPIFDARTIAQELQENYGFQVELVLNPTNSEMMSKLKNYARKTYQPNDQLFIFFAGHGQFDETFKEGYIVCSNSLLHDDAKTSYIPHSTLRTVINNIAANHIFLVMDVCFGGTFDPLLANRGNGGYGEMGEDEFVERKLRFTTRKYLTSGGKEYVPDGVQGHHSPFARKILEALRTYGGSDNIITLSELLVYFQRLVPEPRFGEFGDNQPGSDFLFIAK